jgi:hypothetical protein
VGKINRKPFNVRVGRAVLSVFVRPVESRRWLVGYRDGDQANPVLANLFWRDSCGTSRKDGPSMSFDAAWIAANRVVNRALPAHIRDDVVSDIVVAHLSGELAADQITAAIGQQYVRAHFRKFGTMGTVSLDQPMGGEDGLRLIDRLNTEGELV